MNYSDALDDLLTLLPLIDIETLDLHSGPCDSHPLSEPVRYVSGEHGHA